MATKFLLGFAALLVAPVSAFARMDAGGCMQSMSSAFEESVKERDTAIVTLCRIDCKAYQSLYCEVLPKNLKPGDPIPGNVIDDQIRRKINFYLQQQSELTVGDEEASESTPDAVAHTHKRLANMLKAQASDVEEQILKQYIFKAEQEWINRFTTIDRDLADQKKADPKNGACKDFGGILKNKGALLSAMGDMADSVTDTMECLDKKVDALTGDAKVEKPGDTSEDKHDGN
jgi:hypothetical protein